MADTLEFNEIYQEVKGSMVRGAGGGGPRGCPQAELDSCRVQWRGGPHGTCCRGLGHVAQLLACLLFTVCFRLRRLALCQALKFGTFSLFAWREVASWSLC